MAADTLAELFVKIHADQKEITSQFAGIKGQVLSLASSLGGSITAALGPVGAAIAGAFAIKELVSAFMEGEAAAADLASALDTNGHAVDENVAKFNEFAAAVQAATKYDDEFALGLITKGINLGLPTDQVEDYAKAAIGLGKAIGIGPEEAMAALAKEAQGVESNLNKSIPGLKAVENQTERLALISQFAGKGLAQEEAAAQTLSGQIAQLWNEIGNLAETLGGFLAPVVGFGVQLLKDLTAIVQDVATAFADCAVDTADLGQFMRDYLLRYFYLAAEVLKAIAPVAVNVFGTVVGWLNHAASAALDFWAKVSTFGVRLPEMWNHWLEVASSVLSEIGSWFGFAGTSIADFVDNAINDIATFISDVTFTLLNLDLVFQEIGIFLADFAATWQDKLNYVVSCVTTFGGWLYDNLGNIFLGAFENSIAIVSNQVENLISILTEAWGFIRSGGTDAFEPMLKSWDEGTKKLTTPLKMPNYTDSFDEKEARRGLDEEWAKRKKEWDSITRADPLQATLGEVNLDIVKEAADDEKKKKDKKEPKTDVGTFSNLGEAFKRANSAALKAEEKRQDDLLKENKKQNQQLQRLIEIEEGRQFGLI